MLRLIVVCTALLLSFGCTIAEAQTHGIHRNHQRGYGQGRGYGSPYPIYDYGRGYYGYVYDPYAGGSFKMYDPADDPYLRAKYKYDTFFPGIRSKNRRLFRRRR